MLESNNHSAPLDDPSVVFWRSSTPSWSLVGKMTVDEMSQTPWTFTSLLVLWHHTWLFLITFGSQSVGKKVEVLPPELLKQASFCVHTSKMGLKQLTTDLSKVYHGVMSLSRMKGEWNSPFDFVHLLSYALWHIWATELLIIVSILFTVVLGTCIIVL